MVIFEFFQLMGFVLIMGFIAICVGSAIIGEVAEKVANDIRQRAYEQVIAEGLGHDDACKRMDEKCPFVLAEDVRANVFAVALLLGIVALFFMM
ncbi:MAG: hypothetical protein IJ781_03545 [Atopobiaceae bacterium]|nr:hypothetical protein [Atopobiaceae bacterium]